MKELSEQQKCDIENKQHNVFVKTWHIPSALVMENTGRHDCDMTEFILLVTFEDSNFRCFTRASVGM